MRIQELEQQVGIERATIRYYEKEGLISPRRSENGYRDYSAEDAAELMRIRLLRDLGLPLETIRNLQMGNEEMTAVMERQSTILRGRQQQMERAQAVCDQITADGVSYLGLDTVRYQNLLNAPALPGPPREQIFRDRTPPREPHPWRRYFARMLDHTLVGAVVWLVIVVLLRWRPAGDILNTVAGYAAWFILMPIEALLLHLWGTTPGKWVFGIRVEAEEGVRLSFSEALGRAWNVFYLGMGLGIPVLNLVCMYRAYRAHSDTWDTEWDETCEVSFRHCGWKNILLGILMYTAAVGLNVVAELDADLPRYRSNALTVSQFASNFNFYDQLLMNNTTEFMGPTGVLDDPGYYRSMVLEGYGEVEYDPNGQFEFELEGKSVKRITYHHSWYEYDSRFYLYDSNLHFDSLSRWLPSHCRLALLTAVLSQDGKNQTLAGYYEQLQDDLTQPAGEGCSFTYGDVTVSWDLDLELFVDYAEDSTHSDVYDVTLDISIEFP